MDLSVLIFVALAVAWGIYLAPKAFRQRSEQSSTGSAERFSDRLRVLARREPTSSTQAHLVVTPAASAANRPTPLFAETAVMDAAVNEIPEAPVQQNATDRRTVAQRREAARNAMVRRRNVLFTLCSVFVTVAGLSLGGLFSAWWMAAPTTAIAAWLVTCRLMVKAERGQAIRVVRPVAVDDEPATELIPAVVAEADDVAEEIVDEDPSRWDMVPVTLPTYVTKPAAESTVSTIDLDGTGVWTSGRTEIDAEISRQAEARRQAARRISEASVQQRAVGS